MRAMAIRILKSYQIPDRAYEQQARAIHHFVQRQLAYVNEPEDLWMDPIRVLWTGGGDCDDHAIVLSTLLEAIALPTRLVVLRRNGRGFHVFVEVGLPRRFPTRWIPAETTLPVRFGFDPRTARRSQLRAVA